MQVRLNSNVGIFVTMNPGYAGRSNLPDNLKQLFRAMAMCRPRLHVCAVHVHKISFESSLPHAFPRITPNKTLIAQVNLYNQGFISAEKLASKAFRAGV